ncbi:hypothetical protein [uncultured Pseudoteredinibacter sp.]|uniref:hypothetical protein n=1 Tax=uncultured Pseudoteredinibacter sp. TaxID=1641701 RepID=UPI002631B1DF|nr:hypothetical protein [uncultured Pseudoteredinibacter sp.]
MKPALWLLLILVVIGLSSYCHYEPGVGTKVYVKAEVLSYSRGSRKASVDPAYYVKLPSGLKVNVRDWGELPSNYKGAVILEQRKGQVSGMPVYRINLQRTKELHNKKRQ